MESQTTLAELQGETNLGAHVYLRVLSDKYDITKLNAFLTRLHIPNGYLCSLHELIAVIRERGLMIRDSKCEGLFHLLQGASSWEETGHDTVKIRVHRYERHLAKLDIPNVSRIIATVELTPSDILESNSSMSSSYDGTITRARNYEGDLTWCTDSANIELHSRYVYEDSAVFDSKATIQIYRPAVVFRFEGSEINDLSEATGFVERELTWVCIALSLCYRKRVTWYKLSLDVVLHDGTVPVGLSPLVRRRISQKPNTDKVHELINHFNLVNGGFEILLNQLRESCLSNCIVRSIRFLSASTDDNSVEMNYLLVIAALECFCNGYISQPGKRMKIPAGPAQKISKALSASINDLRQDTSLAEWLDIAKSKLPELNRPTTFSMIQYCCKELDVMFNDLWNEDGPGDGIKLALRNRNHLVHNANSANPRELYPDTVRLRILAERLILSFIEWDPGKLSLWHAEELLHVNQS